jgi:amino acid transporter
MAELTTDASLAAPATTRANAGLGLRVLFSASIGVIVAQVGMVSMMQGIGIGGWGFLVALAVAFALALSNALAFAEMSLLLPSSGSLSTYAEAALGNFPAILLVFAGYITPAIFGLPAELILADQILTQAVPIGLPPFTWPIALIVVFAVLNMLGSDVFARVQTALSFTVLCFLVVTGLVAISGHAAAPALAATASAAPGMAQDSVILGVVALAFWVFVGSEFVTPLVTEARNPNRDLPRAMIIGLLVVFAAELVFGIGAGLLIPRDKLTSSPTPHLDYAVAVFGPSARVWFAGLALVASASLVNTVLASIPRMLAGMADNGQVFPIFKYHHPRWKTPVVAILFVAALPVVGIVWSGGDPGSILPLTIAASVAWLLAYIMAQVSLIVLRKRYPQRSRPFKMPGYPLVPVLAIAGMIFVVSYSSPAPEMTGQIVRYTGIVLVLFAVVGAIWVKVVMKKGLFEPTLAAGMKDGE